VAKALTTDASESQVLLSTQSISEMVYTAYCY